MKILGIDRNAAVAALTTGRVSVAVYGIGKMGLPLAAVFAESGVRVIGVDIDEELVSSINRGNCPVKGEPGLAEMVTANVASGRLVATTDITAASHEADVMIVLVPSLLDDYRNPDLSAVIAVCENIARGLSEGDLVVLETTVPPLTTRGILYPILKRSGLHEGEFGLAFCPERTSSGRAIRDITGAYSKIVGGIDERSTDTAAILYSVINKKGVIPVSSCTTAEAIKLFECIHRDVNIAFSNEVTLICREIGASPAEVFERANEVINDATGHPFVTFLRPGPGVGGHCIPVYPYFVSRTIQTDTFVIQAARKRNEMMPFHMVDLIVEGLNEHERSVRGSNILILGLAYRGGVKEMRYTPTLPVVRSLQAMGGSIELYDPMFTREEVEALGISYGDSFDGIDCAVLMTDHMEFTQYNWEEIGHKMRTRVIVDGRQMGNPKYLRTLDFTYKGIGNV